MARAFLQLLGNPALETDVTIVFNQPRVTTSIDWGDFCRPTEPEEVGMLMGLPMAIGRFQDYLIRLLRQYPGQSAEFFGKKMVGDEVTFKGKGHSGPVDAAVVRREVDCYDGGFLEDVEGFSNYPFHKIPKGS